MTKIHNVFVYVVAVLRFPFRPHTWRWLFLRKTKCRVYLSSGQHVDVLCTGWSFTLNSNNKKYTFEGMTHSVLFDLDHVIAVQER